MVISAGSIDLSGVSIGLPSKTNTKVAKSTSNGVTKHGNRTVTSVGYGCFG